MFHLGTFRMYMYRRIISNTDYYRAENFPSDLRVSFHFKVASDVCCYCQECKHHGETSKEILIEMRNLISSLLVTGLLKDLLDIFMKHFLHICPLCTSPFL